MARKAKKVRAKSTPVPAEKSGKKGRGNRGKALGSRATQFGPSNPWRFVKGQSGNPGGRPKLLSDGYREWLAAMDEHGITNAAYVTLAVGDKALVGDDRAVREIRQATEGERIRTWRDDVVDLLREGKVTPDDVISEFGADEAQPLIIAAGVRRDEGGSAEGEGGEAGGK